VASGAWSGSVESTGADMQWFNNMKIGTRLGASFAFVLTLLAIIAYAGMSPMGEIRDAFGQVVNERNVKIALANQELLNLNVIARSINRGPG
jgi:methyl-accepting chemotaxis protein